MARNRGSGKAWYLVVMLGVVAVAWYLIGFGAIATR